VLYKKKDDKMVAISISVVTGKNAKAMKKEMKEEEKK
jgi:hypothetical protein